jgi:hypothetical protein
MNRVRRSRGGLPPRCVEGLLSAGWGTENTKLRDENAHPTVGAAQ